MLPTAAPGGRETAALSLRPYVDEVPFKSGLEVSQHGGLLEVSARRWREAVRAHLPLRVGPWSEKPAFKSRL